MNLNTINSVIVGASGETGRAIRKLLLEQGATVIGTTRQSDNSTAIVKHSEHHYAIEMNPSDTGSIQTAIRNITKHFSQIHVWINIVGGFEMGDTVEDSPRALWDKMWNLNFLSALNTSQAILPHFKQFKTG